MTLENIDLYSPVRRSQAKLVLENVSKQFGEGAGAVQALALVNLVLCPGDFVCVVGPSGCGKSTLLNLVAGFESPSSGRLVLDGQAIDGPGSERGVVFQQGALFNWMTVLENVAFGPRARGMDRARERAMHYLELVGLAGFAHRYPYELSGGMQQRVGIARALANEPEMLLMDEPFAALDQQNRELLQEEIKDIWRRTGKTVLWITHSIEESLFLATHVLVMTARPGAVKAAFQAEFSRSEDPFISTTSAFAEAKRQILGLLREESLAARRQEVA